MVSASRQRTKRLRYSQGRNRHSLRSQKHSQKRSRRRRRSGSRLRRYRGSKEHRYGTRAETETTRVYRAHPVVSLFETSGFKNNVLWTINKNTLIDEDDRFTTNMKIRQPNEAWTVEVDHKTFDYAFYLDSEWTSPGWIVHVKVYHIKPWPREKDTTFGTMRQIMIGDNSLKKNTIRTGVVNMQYTNGVTERTYAYNPDHHQGLDGHHAWVQFVQNIREHVVVYVEASNNVHSMHAVGVLATGEIRGQSALEDAVIFSDVFAEKDVDVEHAVKYVLLTLPYDVVSFPLRNKTKQYHEKAATPGLLSGIVR